MNKPNYLLRFDDICPTMNWAVWDEIEASLILNNIRPILAIIPDNKDTNLMLDPPKLDFWDRVRKWQAAGYTIAMHGFQHLYVNHNSGLMRLTAQSEFAGLSLIEQKEKIAKSLNIFRDNGVRVDAWIAPSHSFDKTTLSVLAEHGINVVSDGLWPFPFKDKQNIFWVPQQLWSFKPKNCGVWTVCLHHNNWSVQDLEKFIESLSKYAPNMSSLADILHLYSNRTLTISDRISASFNWLFNHRIRSILGSVKRIFKKL